MDASLTSGKIIYKQEPIASQAGFEGLKGSGAIGDGPKNLRLTLIFLFSRVIPYKHSRTKPHVR